MRVDASCIGGGGVVGEGSGGEKRGEREMVGAKEFIPIAIPLCLFLAVIISKIGNCETPGMAYTAEEQAKAWATAMKIEEPIIFCTRVNSYTADCTIRLGERFIRIECYTGCSSCRDAMPGECKIMVGE